MKHHDSRQENGLWRRADQRAKEYFDKLRAESKAKHDAAMAAFRRKVGLKPGQALEEAFGLKPGEQAADSRTQELDPEVAAAIHDFLDNVEGILSEGTHLEDEIPSTKPPQE